MVNHSRVVKLLEDYKEWKSECFECIEEINNNDNEKIKKMLFHSIRAYFLDFHILCEDYISINLSIYNYFFIYLSICTPKIFALCRGIPNQTEAHRFWRPGVLINYTIPLINLIFLLAQINHIHYHLGSD